MADNSTIISRIFLSQMDNRPCSFRLEFDFRDGKESSREVCIVYAPSERRRHLERVFCALMYRYAATE